MVDRTDREDTDMKLGFTGSREGATSVQLGKLTSFLRGATEFHHGDCVGADEEANELAFLMQVPTVLHPPTDNKQRAFTFGHYKSAFPAPYLVRNQDIVNQTDVLVAFPKSDQEEIRSGTWSTIRYARKIGKQLIIIYPDGRVEKENDE